MCVRARACVCVCVCMLPLSLKPTTTSALDSFDSRAAATPIRGRMARHSLTWRLHQGCGQDRRPRASTQRHARRRAWGWWRGDPSSHQRAAVRAGVSEDFGDGRRAGVACAAAVVGLWQPCKMASAPGVCVCVCVCGGGGGGVCVCVCVCVSGLVWWGKGIVMNCTAR